MNKQKLKKYEDVSDRTCVNDEMAGNEMRVTIDINNAQLSILASGGWEFLKIWDLAKTLLDNKAPKEKSK